MKLWLSWAWRSFECFLISIIPCAVFHPFDCTPWNKQTYTNNCTGYCHHLRIIEMCGWHVSSPSLLAGLIRAPLPGEQCTHWADIWWLWSTHTRQLLHQFNHLGDALHFSFCCFSFNSSITNYENQYLVGCSCMGMDGYTQSQWSSNYSFPFGKTFVDYIWRQS